MSRPEERLARLETHLERAPFDIEGGPRTGADPREAAQQRREQAETRRLWGESQDPVELLGLGLWRAWVDAHGAHPHAAATVDEWDAALAIDSEEEFRAWLAADVRSADRAAVACFRSAVLQDRERRTRPAGLARHLPPAADERLTDVLGPRAATDQGPRPIDEIIGWHDERGDWHEGLAGLTGQEQRAYELLLEGKTVGETRRLMSPAGARRWGWTESVLAEQTVKNLRCAARRKLAELFGALVVVEPEPADVGEEAVA